MNDQQYIQCQLAKEIVEGIRTLTTSYIPLELAQVGNIVELSVKREENKDFVEKWIVVKVYNEEPPTYQSTVTQ